MKMCNMLPFPTYGACLVANNPEHRVVDVCREQEIGHRRPKELALEVVNFENNCKDFEAESRALNRAE